MGQALQYPPYLQQMLDEGLLTQHQAWRLMWDLEILPDQPWTPGVLEINLLVNLFYSQNTAMQ